MGLLVILGILAVWIIAGLKDKFEPSNPPIDDISEHCNKIFSLPDAKSRRKYLKKLRHEQLQKQKENRK